MLLLEALAAAILGLAVLWLVLRPLVRPAARRADPVFEPLDPEETPKGIALAALKEIEFDRETGKLSDTDYEMLKAKYTGVALEALRREDLEQATPAPRPASAGLSVVHPVCPTCGPRPEPDAVYCSDCGRPLSHQVAA